MHFTRAAARVAAAVGLMMLAACGSPTRQATQAPSSPRELAERTRTGAYEPSPEQRGYYKVGKPYQIAGVWYYPREDFGLVETGIASWYGEEFHGRMTANGEFFDKNDLTAAHPTLQMPSVVRVTNLDNGRSVVVRVNDRGPYARGRVIDVSRRTAQVLGFESQGTAKVKVEVIADESIKLAGLAREGADVPKLERYVEARHGTESTPQIAELPIRPTAIWVQAGAFSVPDNAYRLQGQLAAYAKTKVDPASVNGKQLFRVRMGPLNDVTQADTLLAMLTQIGHPLATVVVE